MTDSFDLENLGEKYDEHVSANLFITKEGPRKALRLLVPTLAKMFIDDILIGKAFPGTLYYDSTKDLEGDNTHYIVREILKNDKHRVYIFFFKHPTVHTSLSIPPGPPEGQHQRPYATFMAPDLKRHLHAKQLHNFSGEGKWVEFHYASSPAKITNLSLSKDITISLSAVHITGKIYPKHHLEHLQKHRLDTQGIIYYQDHQSLVTTEHALYSPDNIVFYAKEDVESEQIAFRLLIPHCLQGKVGSLASIGKIKQYEYAGEIMPM